MRRAAWVLLLSVTAVGVLFLFVLPGRTLLEQRRQLAAVQTKISVLDRANQDLADRIGRLNSDAEVERLARERYGLVKPGEEAYAILPPAQPPAAAPAPPVRRPSRPSRPGLAARWWRYVQFWR